LVENKSFQKLMSIARPGIDTFTRRHLRHLLDVRYASLTESYFSDLGPRTKVSIAIDCWSSPNKKAFMAIVPYYITES
jgi:hypothetical protein